MRHAHRVAHREVGDGAGHAQRAVGAARAPAQARGGTVQELQRGGFGIRVGFERLAGQGLVGGALAHPGTLARGVHAFAHGGAALARGAMQQVLRRQGGHFHMQVDAVEQRAAELALVARDLVRRVAAGAGGVAQKTAGAGVHRAHELEAGREFALHGRARDADVAALQGLAQRLQCRARELGQLVGVYVLTNISQTLLLL